MIKYRLNIEGWGNYSFETDLLGLDFSLGSKILVGEKHLNQSVWVDSRDHKDLDLIFNMSPDKKSISSVHYHNTESFWIIPNSSNPLRIWRGGVWEELDIKNWTKIEVNKTEDPTSLCGCPSQQLFNFGCPSSKGKDCPNSTEPSPNSLDPNSEKEEAVELQPYDRSLMQQAIDMMDEEEDKGVSKGPIPPAFLPLKVDGSGYGSFPSDVKIPKFKPFHDVDEGKEVPSWDEWRKILYKRLAELMADPPLIVKGDKI